MQHINRHRYKNKNRNNNRNNYYKRDNSVNQYFNNINTKNSLIQFIYDKIDLYEYKYKLLETEKDKNFVQSESVITANYSGTNCLLVFMKIMDKFYSFMVDRKTLSFNKNQISIKNVKIIPINVRLNIDIYKGTIIDGILLNEIKNRKQIFIINDMYYFRGINVTKNNILHKNMNINAYLKSYLVTDNLLNTIYLEVNKFYRLEKIKELMDTKLEYSTHIKGIDFFGPVSGTKYIFLYSNGTERTVSVLKKPLSNKKNTNIFANILNNSTATFEIKKTDHIDVYKLYLIEKQGNKYVTKKIGIAYVPNKKCTDLCKTILSNKTKALVECNYNKNKQKWCPIKLSNKKRPNKIAEVLQMT